MSTQPTQSDAHTLSDDREVVIELSGISTRFGKQTVHDGLDLKIYRGDLVARLHEEGRVDATDHTQDGTRVKARVPAARAAAVEQYAST